MSLQIRTIVEKFPDLIRLGRGSETTTIGDLQAPESAKANSLIFVSDVEHFRLATQSPSQIWMVSPKIEPQVPPGIANVLVSNNVMLSMALIGNQFFPLERRQRFDDINHTHPQATVSPSAKIGENCNIGPGARIGDGVEIGANCFIGANSVIEPNVKIGARTHIHPLVFIGARCVIGEDCEIKPNTTIGGEGYGYAQDKQFNHYRVNHYGRVVLEDRVHIGANVQIDRGTYLDSRIGAGTKIDNHCHFGHNIVIGQNTLITGGMIAAGSVTIGSRCVFGGRTTIKGHLSICDGVQIGGMSGITGSITEPGEYGGLPLQPIRDEMRTRASLKKLPLLIKQVQRILKHLGLESPAE